MATSSQQIDREDALIEELREIVGPENVLSEPEWPSLPLRELLQIGFK